MCVWCVVCGVWVGGGWVGGGGVFSSFCFPCLRRLRCLSSLVFFLERLSWNGERDSAAVFVRPVPLRDVSLSLVQGILESFDACSLSNSGFCFSFLSRSLAWRVNESTPKLDTVTRTERSRVSVSNRSCGSTFAFKNKELAYHLLAVQHQSSHRQYTSHTLVRRDCGQRSAVTWTPSVLRDFSTYLVTVVRGNTPIANRWRKWVLPCIAVSVVHLAQFYLSVTLDDRRDTLGSKWERTFSLAVQMM